RRREGDVARTRSCQHDASVEWVAAGGGLMENAEGRRRFDLLRTSLTLEGAVAGFAVRLGPLVLLWSHGGSWRKWCAGVKTGTPEGKRLEWALMIEDPASRRDGASG